MHDEADLSDELPRRRGRGARFNTPNRFEPLHLAPDPSALEPEELRRVPTALFHDDSRSILSRNDSPDIPFTYSLNPYRGCEHGCVYCLAGDTPILMADGTLRPLAEIRVGDAIYGTTRRGWYRRYVRTHVLAHWRVEKPAYRVTLEDGTSLITGADHRFLTERGWKFVTADEAYSEHDYEDGFRAPLLERKGGPEGRGGRKASSTTSDPPPLALTLKGTRQEGDFVTRTYLSRSDRLMGFGAEGLPAGVLEGQAVKSSARLRVVSVEPLGLTLPLYDITTGTGDFIADGVVSHNCYARPSHEYLGFSAGLDFESKIVVKAGAPALLEAAFQKRTWEPQPIAFSGNTDCYQPVERRLRLTRRCLEVCLRYRNPATVLTKSQLVVRDLDVLAELAALDLVAVMLSVTSLRPDVAAAMEPRAARPAARLRALEALAARGVPVGVMVAPIVPGLTDEEVPAILEAAARAGARWAGYQVVRLPGPVEPLFVDWLREAFPDRAERVLRRLHELRGPDLGGMAFGTRMRGEGTWAKLIRDLFVGAARRAGLTGPGPKLATHLFRRPPPGQMELF